jgi:hypothetical protein
VGRGTKIYDVDGRPHVTLEFDGDGFSTRVDALDRAGRLAVGTDKTMLCVWNPANGKVVHHSDTGYWSTTSIAEDGSEIAIVSDKKDLQLVDAKTFERRVVKNSALPMRPQLAWFPDRPFLAMTTSLTTLIVDRVKGTVIEKLKTPRSSQTVFAPKRDRFLMGDRETSVVDVSTWKVLGKMPVDGTMIAASEDGERIVTCGREGPIRVWSTDDLLGGMAAAKAKPKAVARPPKAQPIRGVFFGVPASVPRDALIKAAVNLHYILDRRPPDFAMELLTAASGRDRHWFRFLGTRGRNYLLEPWIESLYEDLKVPIDVVLHTDATVRARRFSPTGDDISVPNDYLAVARVDDPILVMKGGSHCCQSVGRDEIKSLVDTVELYYPPSFADAKSTPVDNGR